VAGTEVTKVNLGSFARVLPGWINTDITPHVFVARIPLAAFFLHRIGLLSDLRYEQHKSGLFRQVRYLDVTKRFPFADDSIDFVFSSHMLEHLGPDQGRQCLAEVHRVLRPGGIVRISVPDLDRLMVSYDPEFPERFLVAFFQSDQRGKNRHYWYYNQVSMIRILRELGFSTAYQCSYRQGHCVDLDIIDNRPESLFVEARK